MQTKLLILDAGHGGPDPGATHGSFTEKSVTLFLAQHLWLRTSDEFHIAMTRMGDFGLQLYDRAEIANALDPYFDHSLFVSLHVNAADQAPNARGHSIFYAEPSEKGRAFANAMHLHVLRKFSPDEMPVYNKGVLPDTFGGGPGFTVLRRTLMPAILCEFGFITNDQDRDILSVPENLERYAKAILCGIQTLFDGG